MSTETDEGTGNGGARAVIWSSDEAAAAQDKFVAESSPLDIAEADLGYGSGPVPVPVPVVAGSQEEIAQSEYLDIPEQTAVAGRPLTGADALLSGETEEGFLRRWEEIQMSFVEDPRQAVQSADTLIQEISATLRQAFEDRRSDLASGWRDGTTDTEQLRLSLWQYRSFISVIIPK